MLNSDGQSEARIREFGEKAAVEKKECRKEKAEREAIGYLINAIDDVIEPAFAVRDIAKLVLSLIQARKIPHIKFEVQE